MKDGGGSKAAAPSLVRLKPQASGIGKPLCSPKPCVIKGVTPELGKAKTPHGPGMCCQWRAILRQNDFLGSHMNRAEGDKPRYCLLRVAFGCTVALSECLVTGGPQKASLDTSVI